MKIVVAVVAVPLSIFLILPLVMIFLWSVTAKGGWLTSILPTQYTLEWYAQLFTERASGRRC